MKMNKQIKKNTMKKCCACLNDTDEINNLQFCIDCFSVMGAETNGDINNHKIIKDRSNECGQIYDEKCDNNKSVNKVDTQNNYTVTKHEMNVKKTLQKNAIVKGNKICPKFEKKNHGKKNQCDNYTEEQNNFTVNQTNNNNIAEDQTNNTKEKSINDKLPAKSKHIKCANDGCIKHANFNTKDSKIPLYCFFHKTESMQNITSKRCAEIGCNKQPSFNVETIRTPLYCGLHRKDKMKNVTKKLCAEPLCIKLPVFNYDGEKHGLYCRSHMKVLMVNVRSKKCLHENCKINASYNYPNETQGLYCKSHFLKDMVFVNKKTCCGHEGCNVSPSFNFPGKKTGLYCESHSLDGMSCIAVGKICIHDGCKSRALYNLFAEKKGIYCFKHCKPDMYNVQSDKCTHDGCKNYALYNLPTEKRCIACSEHRSESMINIRAKFCTFNGCGKNAKYNFKNCAPAIFCQQHKEDSMISINSAQCTHENCLNIATHNYQGETKKLVCATHQKAQMTDITRKMCEHEGCVKRAFYNFEGEKGAMYCYDHSQSGMVKNNSSKCKTAKCKEKAIFGYKNKKKTKCELHHENGMIDLVLESKCSNCENQYVVVDKDIKYCFECCPNDNLEIMLKKICKICHIEARSNYICYECKKIPNQKEWAVVRYIKKLIDTPFSHNSSRPVSECSNKRPDVLFELLSHVVIVEIDENQHKSYIESCECARINEIVSSIGGKSVIFIRYNPDVTYHKKKKINIDLIEKLSLLIETIKNELAANYDIFNVKLIQLFYDDNNKVYDKIKQMNITDIVCI